MNIAVDTATASLGRLRQAGLFAVALAALIGATIPLFRLGFDPNLPAITVAWCLLTLILLAPLFLLERIGWLAGRPNRDLLAGPLTIITLLVALAVSFLGTIGLVLIALAAAGVLADSVRRSVPGIVWRRFWPWILLGVVCFVPLLGALMGVKYANFIADQLALYGRADGDTLFHAAIINGLRYFGMPATGVDGVRPFGYHVGVHFVTSRIAVLANADAIPALIVTRAVLLTPLLIYALVHGGLVLAARRAAALSVIAAILLALMLLLGLPSLGLGVGDIKSESFMLAPALLLLVFTPLYLLMTDRSIESPVGNALMWPFCILAIFVLAAAKVSVGYVFAGIIGYWVLRWHGIRALRFWLLGAAIAAVSLGSLWLFSPSAGESGAVLWGTPFYVEYGFRNGNPLLPLTVNIEGLALIGLLVFRHWRSELSLASALKQNRLMGLETFIIILFLANLPGLIMHIGGADAAYFVQVFDWMAKPLIIAEVLLLRPWAPIPGSAPFRRWAGPVMTGIAIVACGIGMFRAAQTQTNISLAMMALVRTGDPTYFDSTKRKELRADASHAVTELGWGGLFSAPPPKAPATDLVEALHILRATTGNGGALYVPPEAKAIWGLTSDCGGKSMLSMATAGLPMLNGYFPGPAQCPQEFALSGYDSVPAQTDKLDDAGVCMKAQEIGAAVVLTARSLDPADFHTTQCTAQ